MRTPHMNQRSAGRICPMTAADLSGLQPSTGGTAHLLPFGASPLPAVSPEACPPPQYAALRTSDPINNSSISDTAHIIPRQSPPVNKSAPKRQGLRPVLALPRGISFLGESRRTEGAARRTCRATVTGVDSRCPSLQCLMPVFCASSSAGRRPAASAPSRIPASPSCFRSFLSSGDQPPPGDHQSRADQRRPCPSRDAQKQQRQPRSHQHRAQ